jgi:serine/threonine protein kinase
MSLLHELVATPLPGGYRLQQRLGAGAYGEVWRAEAPGGVEVAVKLIPRTSCPDEAHRELNALQLIKRLRHPFLLALQGFFAHDDRLIIILDLADQSLRQRLDECRRAGQTGIPARELRPYFREAAEALDYLHAHGVQHRDIKPDNLLLLGGHVQVADYGVARLLQGASLQAATMMGTPAYMPPEVWDGTVSVHSDQYSLAATWAELRLGRRPFAGANFVQLLHCHLRGQADLSGLGEREQAVLRRALSRDPSGRYPCCLAFVRDLARALAEDAARGAPLPAGGRPARPVQQLHRSRGLHGEPRPQEAEETVIVPAATVRTVREPHRPVARPKGKSWREQRAERPRGRLMALLLGCLVVAGALLAWKFSDGLDVARAEPTAAQLGLGGQRP